MSNLNDLELPEVDEGDEQLPSFDELPAQMGDFADPIQPGPYKFLLPKQGPKYEAVVDKDNKPRLKALFHDHLQLKIDGLTDRFRFTVDNIPYPKGEGKPKVSKMTYLLASVKEIPKSGSRRDMGEALDKACAREAAFIGTTSLSGWCNETKPIYTADVLDEKGEIKKPGGKQPTTMGCGRRFSSNPYKPDPPKANDKFGGERFPIPRVEGGAFAIKFQCKCGAVLRAYSNLDTFRQV